MTTIDIILAIPLAWAIYRGFKKGLILEFATLIGLVAGLYAGIHFSGLAAGFLKYNFNLTGSYLPVVAFALVFILVILGVYFIGKILEKTAETLMLGLINKIGGAVFSFIKMALILSFLFFIINSFAPGGNIISKSQQDKSYLYKSITGFAPLLLPKIKTVTRDLPELKEI